MAESAVMNFKDPVKQRIHKSPKKYVQSYFVPFAFCDVKQRMHW